MGNLQPVPGSIDVRPYILYFFHSFHWMHPLFGLDTFTDLDRVSMNISCRASSPYLSRPTRLVGSSHLSQAARSYSKISKIKWQELLSRNSRCQSSDCFAFVIAYVTVQKTFSKTQWFTSYAKVMRRWCADDDNVGLFMKLQLDGWMLQYSVGILVWGVADD